MQYNLETLQKDSVFNYFFEISKIPRGSGNEKAISDYLKKFAEERNLYVRQDEYNNIVIKKQATEGFEKVPPVILQGHMDMVCEKNTDTNHNFETDPLELYVDDNFLKAKGTTLGADNGIAVAYCLALLDSKDIPHPALEVVVTTDEEVGLTGALSMDVSDLEGQYFINLDSEEEGELVISCAGGSRPIFKLPIENEKSGGGTFEYVKLNITSLKGGHSGMEIDKNRANANVLSGIILNRLYEAACIKLVNISGGKKDNVIPRECFVELLVQSDKKDAFNKALSEVTNEIKNEYKTSDPDINIYAAFEESKENTNVWTDEMTKKVIFLLMTVPNGIQSMSADIPGLVETSINLGTLHIEGNDLKFEFAARSSVRSRKVRMVKELQLFAQQVGATCNDSKNYPEWPFKKDSKLLEHCVSTYQKLYNKKPIVKGIHAGLEAGVFIEKLPNLDAISLGPNVFDVHSPEERLDIESTKRTWDYLLAIFNSLKEV